MTMDAGISAASLEMGDPSQRIHLRTIVCVLAVCFLYVAQLTAVLGAGVLGNYMSQAIGGTSQTVWYSSLITIMTVALNPPISQAADYWGRRWVVIGTPAVGIVGSIIISRAQNFGTLIVGFAILGLAFGSQSVVMSIVSEIVPRAHRPWAQAAVNIGGSLGGVLGLLMGGGLLRNGDVQNYRIYWYIEAGLFALATLGCLVGYKPPPRELQVSLTNSEKLGKLDWIGYALFAPGLALFSMALSWSDNPYSWNDAHILGPFIVGVAMMVVFFIYEWKFKTDGILHHGLWRHRNFALSLVVIFVEGLAFFSANSYFVMELTIVYGETMLKACVNFLLLFLIGFFIIPLFGMWSTRFKVLRMPMIVGGAAFILFFTLMAIAKPSTSRVALWIYPLIGGIGISSILPVSMVAAQLATPPELIAIASSLMVSIRSLGGAVGLAIDNSIFNSAMEEELPKRVSAATLPLGLPTSSLPSLLQALSSGSQEAIAAVPGITPRIIEAASDAMKDAYSIAFRNAWICSAAFCGLMTFLLLFIKEQKTEFNTLIDAPAEVELLGGRDKIASMKLDEKGNAAEIPEVVHQEDARNTK